MGVGRTRLLGARLERRAQRSVYAGGRRRRVSRRVEGEASVGRACKYPIMWSLSAIKFR
jgi:hypothetical protein